MTAKAKKTTASAIRAGTNYILHSLPATEYDRLSPHLENVTLRHDQVLFDVGAAIDDGYFVNTGLVSCLTVMRNGDSVEVGILGDEGFAGLPVLMNIAHSSTRITVQIPGEALKIKSTVLHGLLPQLPMLERMLARFAYLQALQSQQVAACNRLHDIAERLARWLLMTQDRVRIPTLPLTHELLSDMLGTRRSSVSLAAGILQRAGIIDYRRGKVHILTRAKLEEAACECYEVVQAQLKSFLATSMASRPQI